MTNITKSKDDEIDFSIRNFYNGVCRDEDDCNHIDLKNIKLTNQYPGELIIIVNDHRASFVSSSFSWNMDPIKVSVRLYEHDGSEDNEWKVSRPKADRKIQEYVYHIDIEKNWLDFY